MKTSIAAVVAASLFLVAALFGVGSGDGAQPRQPGSIVLAGSGAGGDPGAAIPLTTPLSGGSTATSIPATASGSASGVPAVVAVGRSVQQTNLSGLLSPAPSNSGGGGSSPNLQALGGITPLPGPTIDNQQPTIQSSTPPAGTRPPTITTSPINGPQPGPSPTGTGLKGILGGVGGLLGLSPSPSASPVTPTSTATPPVTSTATG